MPAALTGAGRTVDLRPLAEPPFETILAALGELSPDETVEIVVGFAPVPLYDVLEARGLHYEAVRAGPDEWRVRVAVGDGYEAVGAERHSGERRRQPRTDRRQRPTPP